MALLVLVGVPVFAWAFVRWERRLGRRAGRPSSTSACCAVCPATRTVCSSAPLYFAGYTGILLVLSVYLQTGLGYAPLQAGFLLMPFALGSAIAAPLSGRIVPRFGRRLTVIALAVTMAGVCLMALFVAGSRPERLAWWPHR